MPRQLCCGVRRRSLTLFPVEIGALDAQEDNMLLEHPALGSLGGGAI
jgi:hypothetical protein